MNETKGKDDQGETAMPSGAQSEILDEALVLSHAMKEVKINSDRDFESAKKRFEEARTRATDVFFNEALSAKEDTNSFRNTGISREPGNRYYRMSTVSEKVT